MSLERMMTMWLHLLLPAAGFLIGIIASLTGVGGGIFIVPLLAILFGFIPQHAVGTSLASIIFTAGAATFSYARQGRVFYRIGLLMAITTVPGAYVGAHLTSVTSPKLLGLIFGIFLLFMALRMVFSINGGRESDDSSSPNQKMSTPRMSDAELARSTWTLTWGLGLSFFGGMASGFLGIGGGVLGVPIMNLGMGVPIHYATATSMFTMIFTSISGVAKHTLAQHIHWSHALLLALGTIFGAQVGAGMSRRISGRALRRFFGLVLLLVSLQMIFRFV